VSGITSVDYGHTAYPKRYGVPDADKDVGKLAGSVCEWVGNPPLEESLNNTGYLLVGYDATAADWNRLVNYYRAGAQSDYPIGVSAPVAYSALNLGGGTKAFLATVNLMPTYGASSPDYPSGYLYMVCVLSAHHNVMQAWFANVDAGTTESWVASILRKDKFF
jgi:hypothetical protein